MTGPNKTTVKNPIILNGAVVSEGENGLRCEITTSGVNCEYAIAHAEFEPPAKVVLTDLDGTSVKSEEFWVYLIEKTARVASKNDNLRLTEEDVPFVSGFSTWQHLGYVIDKYRLSCGLAEAVEVYHEVAKSELNEILEGRGNAEALRARAGLGDFLTEIKSAGIKIGLVTSGLDYKAIPEIVGAFRTLGMGDPRDFYDAIITGGKRKERGVYGTTGELCCKPHPWPYVEIGEALAAGDKKSVIVLEDSAAGVLSARIAGYGVIGFRDGNIEKSGVSHLCERMVDSFDEAKEYIFGK